MQRVMSRHERRRYMLFLSIGAYLLLLFAQQWFSLANFPQNFDGAWHALDYLLFFLVTFVVWQQIAMETMLWILASNLKKPKHVPPQTGLKVAFITTFVPSSESPELLHKTLSAMVAVNYDHDTWLLDEGDSLEARKICFQYGVKYFTRHDIAEYNQPSGHKYAAKTKGGNHNAWYDRHGHEYDIVAQIDTDFIPAKNFLIQTLGYFRDPKIAFVGTPQVYGNTERSLIAKGAAEQQFNFYGPIMQGLTGRDTTLLIGANHVIRVSALKQIDYYRAHLTEDLLTGMTLHSKGYRSVYVPKALAVGEGPETWEAYFNQQLRWAHGCFDILFRHSRKLRKSMIGKSSMYYWIITKHYYSGLALILGLTLMTLYFVTGIQSASLSLRKMLELFLPILLWEFLFSTWLQRYNIRPKEEKGLLLHGRLLGLAVLPIFFMGWLGAIRGKKLAFKVTPKGQAAQQAPSELKLFIPHLLLGSISALGIVIGYYLGHVAPFIVFWACLNTVAMYGLFFTEAIRSAASKLSYIVKARLLQNSN